MRSKLESASVGRRLERFQAKWTPVRIKKARQIKNLEPRFDSIEAEKALGGALPGSRAHGTKLNAVEVDRRCHSEMVATEHPDAPVEFILRMSRGMLQIAR